MTKTDTKNSLKKTAEPASPESGKDESPLLAFCKKYKNVCQWICFMGILLCYSYYAYL